MRGDINMNSKIVRTAIYVVFILFYVYVRLDSLIDDFAPNVLRSLLMFLVLYLPILFILCYRSISPSLLVSVTVSILSFISFMLCILAAMYSDPLIHWMNRHAEIFMLLPLPFSYFWGYIINWGVRKMNPDMHKENRV